MTKQEEIREGVARIGLGGIEPLKYAVPNENGYKTADDILAYLHSQGLALYRYPERGENLTGSCLVFLEPLVEEEK